MTHDDKSMVAGMQRGDRQAFATFVDAYGGRVHRLVRRYVDNATDAEDVTQEIFCDLYRSIGRFRSESTLQTWVYRVAVNHCLKHRQRKRGETLPYDEQTLPDSDWHTDPVLSASNQELSEQIQTALGQLSPLHADVVILCEMHGLTYQECAAALEIPVGTVKSRLFHAFRKMRSLLRDYVAPAGETDTLKPALTGAAPLKQSTQVTEGGAR